MKINFKAKFVAFLRWALAQLGDESPKEINATLINMRDNHIFHLQLAMDDIQNRVGQLEGKMWILITVSLIILGSVLAPLAVEALAK